MKRFYYLIIFAFLLTNLIGTEIGLQFDFNNFEFDKDREDVADDPLTAEEETDDFKGDTFFYGFSLYAIQQVNDYVLVNAGLYNDPILRNICYSTFYYREKFFELGVGPFFGFFNSTSALLKSGLTTSVKLQIPGKMYLLFRTDTTLGGRLVEDGDYLQERGDIGFGFYVPNAICSVFLETKKYTEVENSSLETIMSRTRYYFKTETFKKNIPYTITLDFIYQILSKEFIYEAADDPEHKLNSLILGMNFKFNITSNIRYYIDFESSIYTFGSKDLGGISNPGPNGFLFNASTGVTINIE